MKKFEKVKQYILEKIQSGLLVPGDRIPTEAELTDRFSFSRNPVRKALDELAAEGYIEKVHGSGSYVREDMPDDEININVIMYYNRFLESRIIQGMRKAVDHCSYSHINLILKRPGKSFSEYREILENAGKGKKCGVLCVPLIDRTVSFIRLLEASFRKLEKAGIPLVQVDQFITGDKGSCVMSDHRRGAADMTRLILENGHRKIAVIHERFIPPSISLRIEGVEDAVASFGRPVPPPLFIGVDPGDIAEQGFRILRDFTEKGITAVFCLNCELAFEMNRLFRRFDIRIPGDLSLCSFDDHCFSEEVDRRAITAVIQPFESVGYYAANILLDHILGRTSGQVTMLLKPEIIDRGSLGICPGSCI